VYDTIINLDREIALVWRDEWTVGKLLYLFVRYFGVTSQFINIAQWTGFSLSDTFCQNIQVFSGVACQALVAAVQFLLVRRVRAFYMHNAFLRTSLLALLAAGVIAQVVILGMTLSDIVAKGGSGAVGCYTTYYPEYLTEYWLPPLIVESILLAFVAARVVRVVRRGWTSESTHMLVMHDGVLYFALLFVALLANMLVLFLVPDQIAQVGTFWLVSLMAVSGAHMHLSYQEARARLSATPRQKKEPAMKALSDSLPLPIQARRKRPQQPIALDDSYDSSPENANFLSFGRCVTCDVDVDTALEFNSHTSAPARMFDAGAYGESYLYDD